LLTTLENPVAPAVAAGFKGRMTELPPEIGLRRLRLARPHLDDLPAPALPAGFVVRPFAPGDEAVWLAVVGEADRVLNVNRAMFDRAFALDPAELPRRLLFLAAATGEIVGTAAAWFDEAGWGRVHWLAVRPPWQGWGVGRALLILALHRLRELGHSRAFLITEAARLRAIRLYLGLGFQPEIHSPAERETWEQVQRAGLAVKLPA
jgi:GNAT superfamily N-acetyltransferase